MRVLLLSSLFYGHPVVYCRVISRILLAQGCSVFIASFGLNNFVSEWPEVSQVAHGRLRKLDLGGTISPTPGQLRVEQIVNLQRENNIDVTLFVHADYLREEFIRIGRKGAPHFHGRTVGIFSYTARWYPGEDPLTGKQITWYGPTLRRTLGNLKRSILDWETSDVYFFENVALSAKVLSSILVKDERISTRFGPPVFWMPDIYKVFHDACTKSGRDQFDRIATSYEQYLFRIGERKILLYFGNAAWYKGYDLALQLAARDHDTCFVHCGKGDLGDHPYEYDVRRPRERLAREGRLYEAREYLLSQKLIELFFCSARHIVSTHRLTGTSGTMLQALDCGSPILTADSGLLGFRTKSYKLGRTYEYGNLEELYVAWSKFKRDDPVQYLAPIRRFMTRFSEEALTRCICKVLLEQ